MREGKKNDMEARVVERGERIGINKFTQTLHRFSVHFFGNFSDDQSTFEDFYFWRAILLFSQAWLMNECYFAAFALFSLSH